MKLQPYVHFNGRCEEAIEFYKKTLGAKVNMLMRFGECPDPNMKMDPKNAEKIMHGDITIGENELLVSDGHCDPSVKFEGFSLTLIVKSEADATKTFNALADGGKVGMPLSKTFFSPAFGMLNDRFGLTWMVIVQ